ncbi:MAG TPA: hypothetical protein VK675_01285 [Candidatus Paceibacterota bacterium]|nr:hypothetical protein [Candidatus Paceibacterota bacterium]
MKKYISSLIAMLIIFAMAVSLDGVIASAEDSGNANSNTAIVDANGSSVTKSQREAAKQKLAVLKEQIKKEKNDVQVKIKMVRVAGRENALARLDAAVLRITNLKVKVVAEIAKLEAKGVDVSSAKNSVATAETKLTAANEKIAEINTLLSASINELVKGDKTKLRTLGQDTETLIKDAHLALIDAIKSLKEGLKAKVDAENGNGGI